MSDKHKEASGCFCVGSRYDKIKVIFDQLPDRFKLHDMCRLAKIKANSPPVIWAVTAVLVRDFHCTNIKIHKESWWKKP